MIKVLSHGDREEVINPINGERSNFVNVRFTEEGRGGVNDSLSTSSDALRQAVGREVGLNLVRTHSQLVLEEAISEFPVGREFNLYINRMLFSLPQMRQQESVAARMIDGQPTYFTTYISTKPEKDVDHRMSNEALVKIAPHEFTEATTGTARINRFADVPFGETVSPLTRL